MFPITTNGIHPNGSTSFRTVAHFLNDGWTASFLVHIIPLRVLRRKYFLNHFTAFRVPSNFSRKYLLDEKKIRNYNKKR